ncbi:asparagine synthase (glutamine-hydrolyzing) [Halomicroarcula sp. S1AR25-4]|uniref:asparagine synthase (glutamine-hydrolyzing) n=1 Tax=Haloarcula sp. S1AR25-4 TaxID=2950538 RepID=UPI0028751E25|nr:asparagine synthase (glutamine-hydrolyzing) [Halomicroarcula sp. S1AR25-4]MDS0276811.1 asparagine synthase (glutamine-hydrolyzing) [Halomicroarcula sp. S1AR25-4]
MCGIGGKVSFGDRPSADLGDRMAEQMTHRGPDADGVYANGPAMLAHRRLSILDLSAAGRQPMANADGTVHIVFNGEIYNYRELRDGLDGYSFRSETDTEVLLHLYEEHGLDCLSMLRGMFAFGIWDEREERLVLARDRLGQKPLFYHDGDDGVTFSSTISALLTDDGVPRRPDLPAIRAYLTYQYVPSPATGFDEIRQLEPGEYAVVDDDGMRIDTYWSLSYRDQFTAGPGELADKLRKKLTEATRLRMRSDVPLGVFLSGGIDSTIVTGLMDEVAETDIETYSIGFGEYDELDYARAVAREYDTDHTEYTVTPDAMAVLPELVRQYEMPFGDPSAIPTYYVSQVASDDITVAVTGDAGDENFAGYDRYTYDWLTQRAGAVPEPVREAGRTVLDAVPHESADRAIGLLTNADGDAVERYAPYICHMQGEDADEVWTGPEPADELAALRRAYENADGPTHLDRILHTDVQTYLPDDLLVKTDRASMAHSLELRSPFLDHELVEFAARIPAKYKWRRGEKKWLLKRAFEDYIPEAVQGRSKQGFAVPVNAWFRGALREYAREKFDALGSRDPFDRRGLDAKLDRHTRGEADLGYHIWDLVLLEQWYETFIDR